MTAAIFAWICASVMQSLDTGTPESVHDPDSGKAPVSTTNETKPPWFWKYVVTPLIVWKYCVATLVRPCPIIHAPSFNVTSP
jgi:hypothetical protein